MWSYDKNLSCEKYVQKNDQIHKYDEKFFFFEDIIQDLENHVKYVDLGSIRVNLRPIIKQIQEHAQDWINTLGRCVCTKTRMDMYDLKNQIEVNKLTICKVFVTEMKEVAESESSLYRPPGVLSNLSGV